MRYDGAAVSRISDSQFRIAAVGAGAILFVGLFALRFCGERPLPPLPPLPVVTVDDAIQSSRDLGETAKVYRAGIVEDARAVGVEAPSREEIAAALPYSADRSRRTLSPGESIATVGLELTLSTQDIGPTRRQMVLAIRNTTDSHIAYRVQTRPSQGTGACGRKETLAHNAVALAPGASSLRSECLYREGWSLIVEGVETVAIGPLAYHYVSALPPTQLGAEHRVTRGHRPPSTKGPACAGVVLPVGVTRRLERGEIGWRDLIDFYARHNCARFRFPQDYRAVDGPAAALPAPGSVK
jgi:hypothetical protein